MLNYEVVKQTIKDANEDGETEGYCFYAVISASISDKILLGSLAAFATKFFLVNVTDKKIHLFGLDMMGDVKNYVFIPFKEIKQVRISKWMFGLGKKINASPLCGA